MTPDAKKTQNARHRERHYEPHPTTPKHEKSPEFLGIPGFVRLAGGNIFGRGRRIRTLGTQFWSGCGKDMSGHITASFPHG